jgi:protein SCO1
VPTVCTGCDLVLWDNRRVFKNRSAPWFALIAIAALLGGFLLSRQLGAPPVPGLASGTALPQPRPGRACLFTDQLGAPFDARRLVGAPHLLFFGFTYCPDVCPTTLAMLAQLSRDPALAELRTVFVTVDPARDSQEVMRRYVEAFGGNMTGVRGEKAALDALAASLGAAYSVEATADGSSRVDHTATLFYIDRQGRLAAVFTPPFTQPDLRDDLARLVAY